MPLPAWLAWMLTVPAAPVRVTTLPLNVAGPPRSVKAIGRLELALAISVRGPEVVC